MCIRQAWLALEDGSVFEGQGFGATAKAGGEVVFSTGMVGYPESITDPSFHGQILCQTYPLIGNYGVDPDSFESPRPRIVGYVVAEHCEHPSHATSRMNLHEWLKKNGIPGISGIDTRALAKKLRNQGVMRGLLASAGDGTDPESLVREARLLPDLYARNLVAEVMPDRVRVYNSQSGLSVVLIDCGAKESIVRCLVERNVRVTRVPAGAGFREIMEFSPRGVVISNGPGNPKKCLPTITTVRRLMAHGVPLFGICLGHQILSLAAGADTYKLKFGHRSQNQPCLEEGTERCYITSQNHGFAVDAGTLPRGWRPWFTNANDGTNEGVIHVRKAFRGVQFHPEACPGPADTEFLFDEFLESIR